MDELRVPKRAIPVAIRLADGTTADVDVFLADLDGGRERLSDLLEGDAGFVPAAQRGGGTVLLRRDAIAVARLDPAMETSALDPAVTPTEARVQVLLADGSTLEGLLRYVPGPENARVLDHLNEPARFFAVWSPGSVALVAKLHVTRVIPG